MRFISIEKSSEIHSIQGVVFGALIGSSLSSFGSIDNFTPENKNAFVDMLFIITIFISCIAAHFSYYITIGPRFSVSNCLITVIGLMLPMILIVINVESSKYNALSIVERSTGVTGKNLAVILLSTMIWSFTSFVLGLFTNQNDKTNKADNST